MHKLTWLVAGLAFVASPLAAEKPKDEAGDKVVCKGKRERVFGSSFIGAQKCKTAREWKEEEIETKRQLQAFRDNATDKGAAQGRGPE